MRADVARAVFLVLILLVFGLLAAGCYTVLVHPKVEATGEEASTRTCSDCHASADYYYWHFPYSYGWYSRSPWWNRYYHDPWWWDNYWYWKDGGKGSVGRPERPLWQPLAPSESKPTISPGVTPSVPGESRATGQDTGKSGGEKKEAGGQRPLWQPLAPSEKPPDAKQSQQPQDEQQQSDKEPKKDAEGQK